MMKRYAFSLLLAVLIAAGSASVRAQGLSECMISYDVEMTGGDVEPMVKAMMNGSTMKLFFKERRARVEMNMMMMKTVSVVDDEKKEGVVLMDMMGKKMAMVMGEEEFKDAEKEENARIRETGKTKEIAGYTCKQAFATDENGNELEFWYSDKLQLQTTATGYGYDGIKGFPLEMETLQDGMKVKMVANKVDVSEQDAALFDTSVPDGYEVKSAAELQNMGR